MFQSFSFCQIGNSSYSLEYVILSTLRKSKDADVISDIRKRCVFFKLNLTSYSLTLRVISSVGGLGLMDLKKYVDRRKFSVYVVVSELLERAEERRNGTEKVLERWV